MPLQKEFLVTDLAKKIRKTDLQILQDADEEARRNSRARDIATVTFETGETLRFPAQQLQGLRTVHDAMSLARKAADAVKVLQVLGAPGRTKERLRNLPAGTRALTWKWESISAEEYLTFGKIRNDCLYWVFVLLIPFPVHCSPRGSSHPTHHQCNNGYPLRGWK